MSFSPTMPITDYADSVQKFGYNGDVDTGTEDVISVGGDQSFFTSAQAAADIDIVSSSGDDDVAGTGALTIVLEGIDGDGLLQSETVIMTGAVDTHPTKDYLFIHRAYVATSGSGGVNAGNITIDVGGVTTMAYIDASAGQTLMAAYVVPSNYARADLYHWFATVSGAVNGNIVFDLQQFVTGGSWRVVERVNLSQGTSRDRTFYKPQRFAAGTRLRVRATSSANNMLVSAGFDMFLIP